MNLLIFLINMLLLLWAANHLVTGASGIAQYYKFSALTIGLTLVAIGSSSPQISIAILAALHGRTELALGDAIGANIANIGLVLGLTFLVKPLSTKSKLLRREYPLLLLIMLFTYSFMLDGDLSITDGCLFLVACIALIAYFIYLAQHAKKDALSKEFRQSIQLHRPLKANIISLCMGLVILPLSAQCLVHSGLQLASSWHLSELTLGLSLVAIASCLPNLITSMIAAYQGQDDIAIGNILGSNMFNLLLVMACPSLINPTSFNHYLLWRDIPVMFLLTLVLLYMNVHYQKKIGRWQGGLLLLIYACYMFSLLMK